MAELSRSGKRDKSGGSGQCAGDRSERDSRSIPDLIDSSTVLGLTEVSAVNATVDTNELGDFNANMKALTAVNPHSELIPVAPNERGNDRPDLPARGIIAGQCAVINLDGWTPEQMKLAAPAAIHITYPQLGFRGGGGFGGGLGGRHRPIR
jgi:hypothetical protein